LPLISACGQAEEKVSGKPKEIGVAIIMDLSGPSAAAAAPAFETVMDGLRYFNEVEGGIDGARIVPRWVDTQLQVSRTIAGFKTIMAMTPKPVLGVIDSDKLARLLKEDMEKERVPFICWSIHKELISPPGWAFAAGVPWADHFAGLVDYIVENWTEDRPPKIAYISTDDSWGRASFPAFPYAQERGVKIHTEFMSYLPLDTTPQLLRIRNWGADFVYMQAIETQAAVVLRDAERLGLTGEVQFVMAFSAWAYDVMDLVGATADGVWQIHFVRYGGDFVSPGVEVPPGVALSQKIAEHTLGEWDYKKVSYYVLPLLIKAVLEKAVAEVGLDNLDGAAVYRALQGFEWDPQGVSLPYHWEPGKRVGQHSAIIYELRGGEVIPLTDMFEAPRILEP
jgi:branched-chain amino acid transport system substrate-binding protein